MNTEDVREYAAEQGVSEEEALEKGMEEESVLEPARAKTWPEGFFDSIHVTDPTFERPKQGHEKA